MEAELLSRFSLSDSKGSLEPHKPVKGKKKRDLRITCVPIKPPVANTTPPRNLDSRAFITIGDKKLFANELKIPCIGSALYPDPSRLGAGLADGIWVPWPQCKD
ncbi:hypothetical protein EK904_011617 [Melospiza melodia maxima]|nr:hypothetical protein EK904_011617 [Melospiza melodia maxima]